jgi:hypothetical protein
MPSKIKQVYNDLLAGIGRIGRRGATKLPLNRRCGFDVSKPAQLVAEEDCLYLPACSLLRSRSWVQHVVVSAYPDTYFDGG